ncbi:MAG: hypothetical protein V4547_05470 [Bacteroidota bacterium]
MEKDILQTKVLKGKISLKLQPEKNLDGFCESYFDNYDKERFEAIAIRLYYGKELIVTLYALDKARQQGGGFYFGKLPVKKFKTNAISLAQVLPFVEEFNFTLTSGKYPLDAIEVINK